MVLVLEIVVTDISTCVLWVFGWCGWREMGESPYSYLWYYVLILHDCTPNAYFWPESCHKTYAAKGSKWCLWCLSENLHAVVWFDLIFSIHLYFKNVKQNPTSDTLHSVKVLSFYLLWTSTVWISDDSLINFNVHIYFHILRLVDMQHWKNEGYQITKCSF